MKILLVDDDSFTLKLISSVLEKNGYKITSALSAKVALQILSKDSDFNLIISDIMMPHIDGFAFLRQLRSEKRLSRIPVILCTSLGDQVSIVKGIELGIADYMVKPIWESVLISKVSAVMKKQAGAILAVAEETAVRDVLTKILRQGGWQVKCAGDGHKALKMISEEKIRLILSDINMTIINGLELLVQLREKAPEIPVVLFSDRGEHNREKVVAAGADDFIVKPFHNLEVLACVDAQMKRERKIKCIF